MSALARPPVLAAILAAAGVALHPATRAARFLPAHSAALAALVLLVALALVGRALSLRAGRLAASLLASGVVIGLAALGIDGVRGHHGTLTLAPGQSRGNFDETGPDGRSLGLRPFGFAVGAERVTAGGEVALALPGRPVPLELTSARAVAFGGYRFARPRVVTTGNVSRLRVAASDGQRTTVVDVSPGAEARSGELRVGLEEYFPDFALDDQQKPFSRSREPRNPAALLRVVKGGQAYRAFVLESMPGVHRVEGLGLAFTLLDIEAERAAEIEVHREPAALGVLLGGLLVAAGLAASLRPRSPPAQEDRTAPALVAGAVATALLALVDRGAVLAWSFGVETAAGRWRLAGVGVVLGLALLASLGGSLLLIAQRLSGEGGGVVTTARGALWLAALLVGGALVLAAVRASLLPQTPPSVWLPLAALVASAVYLSGSLLATRDAVSVPVERTATLVFPFLVLAATAVALAVAIGGLSRDGTYAAPATAAAAAAMLLGLSALVPTGAAGLRRFVFLLAFFGLGLG